MQMSCIAAVIFLFSVLCLRMLFAAPPRPLAVHNLIPLLIQIEQGIPLVQQSEPQGAEAVKYA